MATISTLAVNMIARTGAFERKMKKSQKTMRHFGSSAKRVSSGLRRMFIGAVALAGIGGLGFLIKRTMQSIDACAKLSKQLDISTEAIKGYELAAELGGASVESMHKALSIFVRRLGEVKAGMGEAARGIKVLGLETEKFVNLAPEKAFELAAKRISQLGNASDRAFAAYSLFGRSGVMLLPMLKNIESAKKEAERLGLTFSKIDAAKVEAANDAITRMKRAFTGILQSGVIAIAPAIEAIADKLTILATGELRDKIVGGLRDIVTAFVEVAKSPMAVILAYEEMNQKLLWIKRNSLAVQGMDIVEAEQAIVDSLVRMENLKRRIEKLNKGTQGIFDVLLSGDKDVGGKNQPANLLKYAELYERLAKEVESAQKRIDFFGESPASQKILDFIRQGADLVGEQAAAYKGLIDKLQDLHNQYKSLTKAAEVRTEAEKKAAKVQEDVTKKIEERQKQLESFAKSVFGATRTPLEIYEEKIGKLSEVLRLGMIDWGTYGRAIRKAREELEKIAGPAMLPSPAFLRERYAYERIQGLGEKLQMLRGDTSIRYVQDLPKPSQNILNATLGVDPEVKELQTLTEVNRQQLSALERIEKGGLH